MIKLSILNSKTSSKGFSLVELLIVLSIIGVLTSLSVVSYRSYLIRGEKLEAKAQLSSILTVANSFRANTGFYLPNLDEMNISFDGVHSFTYVIYCSGTSTSQVNGGSTGSTTCGTYNNDNPTASTCWMGSILESNRGNEPADCLGEDKYPNDYTPIRTKGLYDFGDLTKEETLKKHFSIRDSSYSGTCERKLKKQVDQSSKDCVMIQQKALDIGGTFNIQTYVRNKSEQSEADTSDERRDFISTPNRFVVTAFGCSQTEDDNCDGSDGDEYQMIRFDSRKIMYEEKL